MFVSSTWNQRTDHNISHETWNTAVDCFYLYPVFCIKTQFFDENKLVYQITNETTKNSLHNLNFHQLRIKKICNENWEQSNTLKKYRREFQKVHYKCFKNWKHCVGARLYETQTRPPPSGLVPLPPPPSHRAAGHHGGEDGRSRGRAPQWVVSIVKQERILFKDLRLKKCSWLNDLCKEQGSPFLCGKYPTP